EPPHKGGPTRPDRPNCSGQWLVVSGQRWRFTYFRVEGGLDMAPLLHEGRGSFALVLGCTFLAFSIDISLLLCFYGGHMGRQHCHCNGRI
ncbi:MAG: hypothetical protein OXH93_14550, partial [Caldilineaceae bacterium]|nr:hypothetical protein [Caldilineaceae bacterium]